MIALAPLTLIACLAAPSGGGDLVALDNLGNGLAVSSLEPQYFEGHVLVSAEEACDGVDYNADGDLLDHVPLLHLLEEDSVRNLGFAGAAFADLDGAAFVAILVSEQDDGQTDYNADGDVADVILFVHDIANGSTTNLGLATGVGQVLASEGKLLFTVQEQASQAQDLNADGDSLDSVLHLYDPATGQLVNSGLASNQNTALFHPLFSAKAVDWILLGIREEDQGGQDLDGDGLAQSERVVHAISLSDGSVINLGINAFGLYGGVDAIDALIHDQRNGRLHTFDGLIALCRNLAVPKSLDAIHYAHVAGRSFVYLNPEKNSDLNGDGDVDPEDWIVHVVSSTTATLNILPYAASDLAVDLPYAAFLVDEQQQSVDLNGDGDRFDRVLHVLDLGDLSVLNTQLCADKLGTEDYSETSFPYQKYLRDGLVTTGVMEADLGGDQNGDGDALDLIAMVVDCATGQVFNSGVAMQSGAYDFDLDAGIVWFSMDEAAQGQDGNGDGDQLDQIPQAWLPCAGPPISSEQSGSLAISSLPLGHALGASDLILVDESSATGDLNGDGDQSDRVLQIAQLQSRAELPLAFGQGTAGSHERVPRLSATGCSFVGGSLYFLLQGGPGNMPAIFVFGTTPQSLPVLGGTLYLFPFDLVVQVTLPGFPGTPAAGFAIFDTGPLAPALVGLTIYAQGGVTDFGAVGQFALSNAVQTTVNP